MVVPQRGRSQTMPDKQSPGNRSPGIRLKPDARLGLDPTRIIPESVRVEFREDPEGAPVAHFVEKLGGYQGIVTDPFGRHITASLEKWRNAPQTRVVYSFTYKARPGARPTE